jgi:hypothetical protein
MNFQRFSSALATILIAEDWSEPSLRCRLMRFLPERHNRHAAPLAKALTQRFPKFYAPSRRALASVLCDLPQTHIVWSHAQQHQTWPELPLEPPCFRPLPAFRDLSLPALTTRSELAEWLGLKPEQLIRFCDLNGLSNRQDHPFKPHYNFHVLPKRSGGQRLIEEPRPMLKHLQRRLLSGMLSRIPASPHAFGFVTGRNCIQGAAKHAGEQILLTFDLRDFFHSIPQSRLFGLFRSLGYPGAIARDLVGLTTLATPPHILRRLGPGQDNRLTNRHLPQGAPTSPALANLCAFHLDRRLAGLARRIGATYTRYADDLSFSGDTCIARALQRAVPDIVVDDGFALNPAKTRSAHQSQQQRCTGLVVNQHVNIPRADYDRLKAIIHHLARPSDPRRADPAFLTQLEGRITWLEQVNLHKGAGLRIKLAQALHPTL